MLLLLVEESEPVRQSFHNLLSSIRGLVVVDAVNLAEGHARLDQARPDVAVIDVYLPDGSGIELLRSIKRQSPATRTIMVSNHLFFRERCLAEGADFFFDRSLDMDYLSGLLKGLTLAEMAA